MRMDYVKELRENDRLQESISGSGCPGVLFLLKRNSNLRIEMKESGSGKTAVRMLPFFLLPDGRNRAGMFPHLHIYGIVLEMDGTGCFYTPAACLLSKTEIAARASESS